MRKLTGLIGVAMVLVAGAAVSYADTPSKQIVTANLVKDKIIAIDHPKFIAANDAHFLQTARANDRGGCERGRESLPDQNPGLARGGQ